MKCKGRDAAPCAFGKGNGALQVGGAYARCVWCSDERMAAACRDSKQGRQLLVRDFKRMAEGQQDRALKRIPEAFHPTFQKLMDKSPRCEGRPGEPCVFQEGNTGEAAYAKKGGDQCMWCSPELLESACRSEAACRKLLPALRRHSVANQRLLIEHRIPEAHRAFFRAAIPAAAPGRGARKRPAAGKAATTWEELLAKRRSWSAPASEEKQQAYRKRKLDDRARVRRTFQLTQGRARRGAEVDNDTGLPPPAPAQAQQAGKRSS